MRVAKEVAEWVRIARDAGWEVTRTAKNHLRFKSPEGKIVHIGSMLNSMNGRTLANARSQLRRGGLRFPEDAKLREQLGGVEGFLHPEADVAPPAFVRPDARRSEWEFNEDVHYHVAQHPEDVLTIEDLADRTFRVSGEIEEIEVASAQKEEEPTMEQPRQPASAGQPNATMFIRFGKLCARIEHELNEDARKLIVELIEQAALLELTTEEMLEALR